MEGKPDYGIYRGLGDDAWYVTPVRSGVSHKPFFDETHGDSRQSYLAAKAYNDTIRPYLNEVKNYQAGRNSKKFKDILPVGISLTCIDRLDGEGHISQQIYTLRVSLFGIRPMKDIYVGNQNTWESNFNEKLEKAIELREKYRLMISK